jgi:hypothetical protein
VLRTENERAQRDRQTCEEQFAERAAAFELAFGAIEQRGDFVERKNLAHRTHQHRFTTAPRYER